jgi:sugar phosphate isomerase/epimerase
MASSLAVQMYTIRDHTRTAADFAASLAKLRAIGYEAVQLSAVGAMDGPAPAVSARDARRMLDDNGLACIATHRSWEALSEDTAAAIDFHHELRCAYTAIGGIPAAYGGEGAAGYRRFVRDAAPTVAALKAAGIGWGHHNHAHEFQRAELGSGPGGPDPRRRTLYDVLIEDGGPDYLLEVDVYWAWHAGVDPAALLRRCAGRVPVIHLKDKEVVSGEGPVIAAIGEGNLPWDTILPACRDAGVRWYAVEQDVCRRDPFDCLRSSFEFLAARGL